MLLFCAPGDVEPLEDRWTESWISESNARQTKVLWWVLQTPRQWHPGNSLERFGRPAIAGPACGGRARPKSGVSDQAASSRRRCRCSHS